ncbi:hypothetical protein AY601_4123 [Pedobacter cryoconitis]|uniref:DUF4468 domain-containing protein n=1 Tax=Pedobacter cryoconitis TaxID=188932 RepID=A0A127VI17_9SPHI|nr:DUF4468 domain-containing protein [Pedobacter cryoconitis]AMQ00974.1 hypothetical protein AY601_4123 [Pedobacter cryoconitis]
MKNTIIILMMMFSCSSFSQEKPDSLRMPSKDGRVEISEVIIVNNKKSAELFSDALLFIAENYNSPQTVTRLSDRTSGKLLVNTFFVVSDYFHIKCILELDIKDGKYKYVFKDFTYQVVVESLKGDLAPKAQAFDTVFPSKNYKDPNVYTKLAIGTLDSINLLITNLKKTMSKNDSF